MSVTCPKCAYVRKPSDTNPEWQCPSCGVAYAKAAALSAEPEVIVHDHYQPEKSAPSWIKPLVVIAFTAAAAYAFHHYAPGWTADSPVVEAAPSAPPAVELSDEEVRGLLGQGGDAEAFMAQHNNNPALENHYYKTEAGEGFSLSIRPLLTDGARARLRELTPQRVVLFGTSTCTYCAQVRRYLAQRKVPYADLDINRDTRAYDYELNVLFTTSYPVVVIDREVMYGYNAQELARAVHAL